MKKISLFATMFAAFFAFGVMNVDAKEVASKQELKDAISNANPGDTITLTQSITLDDKDDILFTDKEITIEGASEGITITGWRDDNVEKPTGNQSIITVLSGGKIQLKNLTLVNSQKYGVQAYDGGYISLENVRINNCRYGAVLLNGGTVEIISLSLGANGEGSNNGIEVSKSVNLADSNNQPSIVMNGTLSSDIEENVIRFADDANDRTTGFIIENKETTTDKILVKGNTVVVTDATNEIKYQSNELQQGATFEGEEYTPNIDVTDPIEPTEPTEEVNNETNPETSDGILLFLGLTIVGFVGTALTYRRLHN